MIIFGIDPGTARLGWAVVSSERGVVQALSYGCLMTDKAVSRQDRLLIIYKGLTTYLKKFKPDCLVLEDLFWGTNAKTIVSVAEARGVILFAAAQAGTAVVSYTPLVVKQTITGSGRADKVQVQKMVVRLLKLSSIPKPDDVTDALAIALTHAYSYKLKSKLI